MANDESKCTLLIEVQDEHVPRLRTSPLRIWLEAHVLSFKPFRTVKANILSFLDFQRCRLGPQSSEEHGSLLRSHFENCFMGVSIGHDGILFVVDPSNHRVRQFKPGVTRGIVVAGGRGAGDAADQLHWPRGLFRDGTDALYVADTLNNRVQRFLSGSFRGSTVAGGNGAGDLLDQLNWPHGIFVDSNGSLYVADTPNDRVVRFNPGSFQGITAAGGRGQGNKADQLCCPMRVFVDAAGVLYVADSMNDRVQQFVSGCKQGLTVQRGRRDLRRTHEDLEKPESPSSQVHCFKFPSPRGSLHTAGATVKTETNLVKHRDGRERVRMFQTLTNLERAVAEPSSLCAKSLLEANGHNEETNQAIRSRDLAVAAKDVNEQGDCKRLSNWKGWKGFHVEDLSMETQRSEGDAGLQMRCITRGGVAYRKSKDLQDISFDGTFVHFGKKVVVLEQDGTWARCVAGWLPLFVDGKRAFDAVRLTTKTSNVLS